MELRAAKSQPGIESRLSAQQSTLGTEPAKKHVNVEAVPSTVKLSVQTPALGNTLSATLRDEDRGVSSVVPGFLTNCETVNLWEFPGGPVIKTQYFQCRGHGFLPWLGK